MAYGGYFYTPDEFVEIYKSDRVRATELLKTHAGFKDSFYLNRYFERCEVVHLAVERGDLDFVREISALGIHPTKNANNQTPLEYAVEHRLYDIVEVLLASPDSSNSVDCDYHNQYVSIQTPLFVDHNHERVTDLSIAMALHSRDRRMIRLLADYVQMNNKLLLYRPKEKRILARASYYLRNECVTQCMMCTFIEAALAYEDWETLNLLLSKHHSKFVTRYLLLAVSHRVAVNYPLIDHLQVSSSVANVEKVVDVLLSYGAEPGCMITLDNGMHTTSFYVSLMTMNFSTHLKMLTHIRDFPKLLRSREGITILVKAYTHNAIGIFRFVASSGMIDSRNLAIALVKMSKTETNYGDMVHILLLVGADVHSVIEVEEDTHMSVYDYLQEGDLSPHLQTFHQRVTLRQMSHINVMRFNFANLYCQ